MEKTVSIAEQDYLKNIYTLRHEHGQVTVQALAERLAVKAPSVTAMIKHLADDPGGPYVTHAPYHGIELTARGEAAALEVIRHHRLLELYLAQQLDMPWDQVHAEAERLEHAISEDLEARIAAKLGQPTRDPHGDPIPGCDGTMETVEEVRLDAMNVGMRGSVMRVPDGEPALLQYLKEIGLVPGAMVIVEEVAPYGDVITVRVGDSAHPVGGSLASRVLLKPSPRGKRAGTQRVAGGML